MAQKIGILGASGRMGSALQVAAKSFDGVKVVASHSRSDSESSSHTLDETFDHSDVVLDFTHPSLLKEHLAHAIRTKTPLLIGTTGLEKSHETKIHSASETIPVLWAANTSLGMNILMDTVRRANMALGDAYKISISEAHHKNKIDSPSGSAKQLFKSLQTEQKIKYFVKREGDVIGDHSVAFVGPKETLSFSHSAKSRDLFAEGALIAAKWLIHQPAGLYTMGDALGLTD